MGNAGAVTEKGAVVPTPVTVSARVAVRRATPWLVVPTSVSPRSAGWPVRTDVEGRPKPITCPSRVPTYTRPPVVAGMANLDAVPIGADQRSCSRPPVGSASYADRRALAPVGPSLRTTQTRAEPGAVPSEVTTGEPEV